MTAPTLTASPLLDILLDALEDGTDCLRDRLEFCTACKKSPTDQCLEHQPHFAAIAEYESTAALIRSAAAGDQEARAALRAALAEGETT